MKTLKLLNYAADRWIAGDEQAIAKLKHLGKTL